MKFRGLSKISGIKSSKKKDLIHSMTTVDGKNETDRKGIADVFADFYEDLFRRSTNADRTTNDEATDTAHQAIPPFTNDELKQAALQKRQMQGHGWPHCRALESRRGDD
eukprot:4882061-Pyramimonas_sp.AAC.1